MFERHTGNSGNSGNTAQQTVLPQEYGWIWERAHKTETIQSFLFIFTTAVFLCFKYF